MPVSGSFAMAPVGQAATHAGSAQWLHSVGRNFSTGAGKVPVGWYTSSPSKLSTCDQSTSPGSSCETLQPTTHVWHPTQTVVSITMPKRLLLAIFNPPCSTSPAPGYSASMPLAWAARVDAVFSMTERLPATVAPAPPSSAATSEALSAFSTSTSTS